jgi:hypothetical protein
MVTNKDLLLMAYPTIHKEREEAIRQQEYMDYITGVPEDKYPFDRNKMKELAARQRSEHEMSGMVGRQSNTSGLSLSEAYAKRSQEDIEREEERYRRGSRQQEFSDEDWARMVDGKRAQVARATKKTTMAMGDSGFGRNPNSAVAQAARRERGK